MWNNIEFLQGTVIDMVIYITGVFASLFLLTKIDPANIHRDAKDCDIFTAIIMLPIVAVEILFECVISLGSWVSFVIVLCGWIYNKLFNKEK